MSKWTGPSRRRRRWRMVTRLMARDGESCTLCGDALSRKVDDPNHPLYITFDHKIARACAGLTTFVNLQLAHRRCNEARGCDPLLPEAEAE